MPHDSRAKMTDEAASRLPNAVPPGPIGIVGSGETAAREVAVRVADFGSGVSKLIPIDGRAASGEADGKEIVDGLKALDADAATQVIVLVLRAPAAAVEEPVDAQLKRCTKPVVVCFIGGPQAAVAGEATAARTTKEAALQAVLSTGVKEEDLDLHALNWPLIHDVRQKLSPEQRYVRGLFRGSDLGAEAMHLAMEKYEDVYGTEHPDPAHRLEADAASVGHTFLHFPVSPDGGSDADRDPSGRAARFLHEAEDREVGVIALDFILGEGAEPEPVGVMLPAMHEAKERAAREGRHLEVLGYVLGTDLDTPSLADQVVKLETAGVTIASSSANTGLLSREFVWKS